MFTRLAEDRVCDRLAWRFPNGDLKRNPRSMPRSNTLLLIGLGLNVVGTATRKGPAPRSGDAGGILKGCMATDPTSNTRNPPSLWAANGVLEDSFYQASGPPLWHAANIYSRPLRSAPSTPGRLPRIAKVSCVT